MPNDTSILELFFKAWIDDSSNTRYEILSNSKLEYKFPETFAVSFADEADAILVKLKGVPPELQKYIEILK